MGYTGGKNIRGPGEFKSCKMVMFKLFYILIINLKL